MSGADHHTEYLDKQWTLAKQELPDHVYTAVKNVVSKGQTDRGWADSTARNYLRFYRFAYISAKDHPRVTEDPVEWSAKDWNSVIDYTATKEDLYKETASLGDDNEEHEDEGKDDDELKRDVPVSAGEKEKYAYAARAFVELHNRVDVDKTKIDVPDRDRNKEKKTKEEVLLEDDIITLIEATTSNRNAAIIAVGYQAALRRDALVNLRVKDYKKPENGMTHIRIPSDADYKGAAGSKVPLTWAAGYLDTWLSEHPRSDEPDAPLFVSMRPQDRGEGLSGHSIYTMMKRLAKDVDEIEDEKIHPHMLRHARASTMRLSKDFDQSDIEAVMQWTQSTPMHATYENLDDESEAERVAMKMGQDITEQDAVKDIDCPRCGQTNNATATFCSSCTQRLDTDEENWWKWYRKIAPEDDPVKEKYGAMRSAVPALYELSIPELDRVHDVWLESQFKTISGDEEEVPDEIGAKELERGEEAMDVWETMSEKIDDIYARKYADDPQGFKLRAERTAGREATTSGYTVDELEEMAIERDYMDSE